METAEHNSKIAEYMGAIGKQDDYEKWGYFYPENSPNYNPYQSKESLNYHKSWDWLMPVVDKINSTGYFVNIFRSCCQVCDEMELIIEITAKDKLIEAVHEAVYQFITEFNPAPNR